MSSIYVPWEECIGEKAMEGERRRGGYNVICVTKVNGNTKIALGNPH